MDDQIYSIVYNRDWASLRQLFSEYAALPRERRASLWFRGQGNANWSLSCTLDRPWGLGHSGRFESADQRNDRHRHLLQEFLQEAVYLGTSESMIDTEAKIELLARHHGLPSPLMDWSLSPYVAAYFAMASQSPTTNAAIWCLDLTRVDLNSREDFEILRENLPIFENRRVIQQRGVFVRLAVPRSLDELVPHALTRFELPPGERELALQDLDEMMVNATAMFYDLQGAAKTAVLRCCER